MPTLPNFRQNENLLPFAYTNIVRNCREDWQCYILGAKSLFSSASNSAYSYTFLCSVVCFCSLSVTLVRLS